MLLAELQHRVRNIMALLRSITNRTAGRAESVAEYRDLMMGRLLAFARVRNPSHSSAAQLRPGTLDHTPPQRPRRRVSEGTTMETFVATFSARRFQGLDTEWSR